MTRAFNVSAIITTYDDSSEAKDLKQKLTGVLLDAFPEMGVGEVKVSEIEHLEQLAPGQPDPRD